LTASAVTSNQTVTVNASYTEGGVTKTATKSVGITASSTTGGLIYHDDFSTATANGAPNWEVLMGAWGGGRGRYWSGMHQNDISLVTIPALEQFQTGRLQTNMALMNIESDNIPHGMMIFSYIDSAHYRYVNVRARRIIIGQVGDFEGVKGGIKAAAAASLSLNRYYTVRLDLDSAGKASVSINGGSSDDDHSSSTSAVATYTFPSAVTGRVGYGVQKAWTLFDEFYAWDASVLGTSPGTGETDD